MSRLRYSPTHPLPRGGTALETTNGFYCDGTNDPLAREDNVTAVDASVPFIIFSGSRISLGGGLDSPDNALKVILLLSVRPNAPKESWTIDLKLQGCATDIP
jgi:hypothetical protein